MLVADVKKRTKHFIRLYYYDSVLAFHSYRECPHILLDISMISQSESKMVDQTSPANTQGGDRIAKFFEDFNQSAKPMTLDDPQSATFTLDNLKYDQEF